MTKMIPTVLRLRTSKNFDEPLSWGYKLTDTETTWYHECVKLRVNGQDEDEIAAVLDNFLSQVPVAKEPRREEGEANLSWDIEIQHERDSDKNTGGRLDADVLHLCH